MENKIAMFVVYVLVALFIGSIGYNEGKMKVCSEVAGPLLDYSTAVYRVAENDYGTDYLNEVEKLCAGLPPPSF